MKRLHVLYDADCALCCRCRDWAQRLATPALLPWARRVCELVSQNRLHLSRLLLRRTPEEIGRRLAAQSGSSAHLDALQGKPGTRLMRTESELVLKSRRVVPGRLLADGFEFSFPQWPEGAADLCARWKSSQRASRR